MIRPIRLLCFLLPLLFLASIANHLYGQSGVYDRVGTIPGHGIYSSLPEESIDLFTGNVTLRYRDIYLPGPNGLDVEVWRVYNSKILKDRQSGQSASVQAYHQSWVGMGWTLHMGMVHQETSNTPVIEFPDGRLETAFPDNYGTGKHITKDFLKYDKGLSAHKLYFKNGLIWTFGATATITRADGSSDPVRLVTRIENAYGHHIDIVYDPGKPTIRTITDSMGRVVTFLTADFAGNPKKLYAILVKDANGNDRSYGYNVGNYGPPYGYYRLDSFTPPMLPATTFLYNDGSSSRYELTKVTTSFGGMLEYSYVNHDFYFNTIYLDSRVASQKKITFNPGDQAKIWNFTYPSYQGVTSGTAHVEGPEFNADIIHTAYDSQNPWQLGLESSQSVSDNSRSNAFTWTYQQISTTNWVVLGVSMGPAKGPLPSTVVSNRVGDASSTEEYLYQSTEPKKYGLPSRINTYVNGGGSPKNYEELTYFFETHSGFASRYMLSFPYIVTQRGSNGSMTGKTTTSYYEETGKWGALKQVQRWSQGTTYYTWDYEYTCTDPNTVTIKVDPPGPLDKETVIFNFGIERSDSLTDFTRLTRIINPNDSSISSEKLQDEGTRIFTYDNAGRVTLIHPGGYWNDIAYSWRPNGENKVAITQGQNTVTKYWDGMGRDIGSTESGDNTTLYFLKTLDAEGRIISENKGSIVDDPAHRYSYLFNAAGQIRQITDPVGKVTTITYQGTTKNVEDAEHHHTIFEYNSLPGLPTRVTDALGHAADYTIDDKGRLTNVLFNGTRAHAYTYDGLDHVTSENHPETGLITYAYNDANLLFSKSWGGTVLEFHYDTSARLYQTTASGVGPMDIVNYAFSSITGRVQSATDTTYRWSRTNITYDPWGNVAAETITIPGLAPKTISYLYDANENPWRVTYPDGNLAEITNNGLNKPEALHFKGDSLVSDAAYGPGKLPRAITFGNQTSFSASYNNAGMLASTSLQHSGTTLCDANYTYDGVGNILGITSTAPSSPTLSATFGYDSLNRLTSANYTSGRVSSYTYDYDEYGNMRTVREGGVTVFSKNYTSQNRIETYTYDSRGNLLSSGAGGNLHYWDSQNRLQYIQNTSGEVLGKYLYDDRGLRLMAVPPLPEINVKHDALDIPSGGNAYLSIPPGQSINETLTIQNLGDANLLISGLAITNDPEDNFDIVQQPSSPVTPGGNTTFIIQFHPHSAGQKTANLTIANNDVDEAQYLIYLDGNYEPEINIPQAQDGGSYDFGTVKIFDSVQRTFTTENLGENTLTLSGSPIVVITGPDSDQFLMIQQPAATVNPHSSTTFIIQFSPNSEGPKTAAISIVNNDWNENPYDITLLGTGEIGPGKIADDSAFTVTSPAPGEELVPSATQTITWTGAKKVQYVKIEYSTDNGSTYQTIVERTPNAGNFPWIVPQAASQACLVRVSSADGAPTVPRILSYEFKVKIPHSDAKAQEVPTFAIFASAPDTVTQTAWTADVVFAADKVRGFETVTLNGALSDVKTLGEFLGSWHQARVEFEFETYCASAWLDGQLLFDKVPLHQHPDGLPSPEIMLASGALTPADVRVEDIEVKFRDKTLRPQIEGEEVFQALARDTFELYPAGVFPSKGGWMTGAEKLAGTPSGATSGALGSRPGEPLRDRDRQAGRKSAENGLKSGSVGKTLAGQEVDVPSDPSGSGQTKGAALIDDQDHCSGTRSLMLETFGTGAVSVVKRFALPARVPYGISEGNFAIGAKAPDPERETGRGINDREGRGAGNKNGKDNKENNSSSNQGQGAKQRSSVGDSASSTSPVNQIPTGNNNRIRTMSASPVGNYYLYSFDRKLLALYNIYGTCLKEYIYMDDRLIAEYDPVDLQYHFYTSDQINSTRIVTDNTGNVVYAAAHDPYGGIQQTWGSNPFNPTPKFSGKERDEESQLDYFGARYYDRDQYRFISVDPETNGVFAATDPQKWNLYDFCWNNPIKYFEPDGRAPQLWLRFNRSSHTMEVMYGSVVALKVSAYNNVRPGVTQFPAGEYRTATGTVEWHESWWRAGIGDWFIRLNQEDLDKNGLKGVCGIHWSDDPEKEDGYGKSGLERVTDGCIRAEDFLGLFIALVKMLFAIALSYVKVI